jgi:hypothetical protein
MKEYKGKFDRLGIAVSFICLVHCVVLPVFLTTLSFAGMEVLHNRILELGTLLLAVSTGFMAMRNGYLKHEQSGIVVVFVLGMVLMISGNFSFTEPFETLCKTAGALLVIGAHIRNFRVSRCTVIPVEEK